MKTKQLNFRVPENIWDAMTITAQMEHRSVTQMIVNLMEKHCADVLVPAPSKTALKQKSAGRSAADVDFSDDLSSYAAGHLRKGRIKEGDL